MREDKTKPNKKNMTKLTEEYFKKLLALPKNPSECLIRLDMTQKKILIFLSWNFFIDLLISTAGRE